MIWIGGMLYFFASNTSRTQPLTLKERERQIEIGKLSRERDHKDRNTNLFPLPKDPKFRKEFEIQKKDARRLSDFNWKAYQAGGALKPGEDKNQNNAYNQEASEALAWDRDVPDVRDTS